MKEMENTMQGLGKVLLVSTMTSAYLVAGGYKLPEQSLNSMALSDAYVAHTVGADTAYYNPAAMAFMGDNQYAERALTLVHLNTQSYTAGPFSSVSKIENIPVLTTFYVAKPMENFRWGISFTVPGGLIKRWETPFQKAFAEDFTSQTVELNLVFSYKVNDQYLST